MHTTTSSLAPTRPTSSFPAASGSAALDALLEAHRDLVLDTVARCAAPGMDTGDLIRAGIEGLLDAASRFDASCGDFASFAAWWVRRSVARAASRN